MAWHLLLSESLTFFHKNNVKFDFCLKDDLKRFLLFKTEYPNLSWLWTVWHLHILIYFSCKPYISSYCSTFIYKFSHKMLFVFAITHGFWAFLYERFSVECMHSRFYPTANRPTRFELRKCKVLEMVTRYLFESLIFSQS